MSAPPYMKLYIADYHVETTNLDVIGHGAYLLLLMAMWRAGGKLPREEAKLRGLAKCTPEQWAAVKPDVMAHFKVVGSTIRHGRVTKEMAKYQAVVESAEQAGKASAEKRLKKNKEQAPTDVERKGQRISTNQNQEPEPELEPKESPGPGKDASLTPLQIAERIWPHVPEAMRIDREKRPLVRELDAAMKAGESQENLLDGIIHYYQTKAIIGGPQPTKKPCFAVRDQAWTFFHRDDVHPRAGRSSAPPQAPDPSLGSKENPGPRLQRSWMEDWVSHEPRVRRDHWKADRGPAPGEVGCRIDPELQRRYGVVVPESAVLPADAAGHSPEHQGDGA